MDFTKTQLNHINKQLDNNEAVYTSNEKDLQLDVSLHKVDGVDMAKIHIATQEEVVFSEWEKYLKCVEDKNLKEKKEKAFMLNIPKYLAIVFFISLSIVFFLFNDKFQGEDKILFYSIIGILPLLFCFIINKYQTRISTNFYKNMYNNLESEFKSIN